jgi:hypothetical protein
MKATNYSKINNEGFDGFVPTDPREARVDSELRAMRDAWTVEVTKERRAAWNAEVMKYKAAGKKINLLELETKMGFQFSDMKRHIVRHGL